MGIHANWKVLLKENYAHCFLSHIDDLDEQLDVLIIDFLPFIFGKSKNIKTGEHFLNYVFKSSALMLATDRHAQIIRDFFDKGGHTCVIAIDTLKYVPLAKAPTQMDRDKYSKPLSKEELGLGEGKEVMGRGMLIHQEWHRVMANRDLREEIFRYFEQEFLRNFFKRVKKETWDKWAHADIAQQSKGGGNKMPREWLKSLVIDGGTRYGPNPYVIYSSGKVSEKPEWRNYIGESDLKIPFYINYVFPTENFLVNSIDSDLIRILLGGTPLRLDPATGLPTSRIYLRLNDAKKTVETEDEKPQPAVVAAVVVDGKVNEDEDGEPPKPQVVKRGRGRPKGSTSKKPSAKAKAAKGKEKAANDTGDDEHQHVPAQEETKSPVESEERETDDTTETSAGESAKGGQEEKAKKEEPEYFYEPDYVDINALWVAIREHWQRDCALISDPISNELVLMTLGGDDFVKNLPNCGAKVLHDVYIKNAERIGDLVAVRHHTLGAVAQVDLNWDALWLLVRYVYRHKLKSHIAAGQELPGYEELRQISVDSLKKQALHCLPAAEIEVKFRQVRWTLLYLLNGYKRERGGDEGGRERWTTGRNLAGTLIPDCLETDGEGRSLHGWELKSAEEGHNRKNIKRSTSISAETRYGLLVDKEEIVAVLRREAEEEETKKKAAGERVTPLLSRRATELVELAVFSLPLLVVASVALYRAWRH